MMRQRARAPIPEASFANVIKAMASGPDASSAGVAANGQATGMDAAAQQTLQANAAAGAVTGELQGSASAHRGCRHPVLSSNGCFNNDGLSLQETRLHPRRPVLLMRLPRRLSVLLS